MDYIYTGSLKISIGYYMTAVFLGAAVGLIWLWRHRTDRHAPFRAVALMFLSGYVFLVFSSTLFSRATGGSYTYMLMPFWSYLAIYHGDRALIIENIFNVLMLLPVGFLLPVVWNIHIKRTVLTGFLISASIEILQLVMKRGLFEFDDMIHNTLGTAAGYGIYFGLCRLWAFFRQAEES